MFDRPVASYHELAANCQLLIQFDRANLEVSISLTARFNNTSQLNRTPTDPGTFFFQADVFEDYVWLACAWFDKFGSARYRRLFPATQ
jgi:hypothetical protein